jgi:hypothetical protein
MPSSAEIGLFSRMLKNGWKRARTLQNDIVPSPAQIVSDRFRPLIIHYTSMMELQGALIFRSLVPVRCYTSTVPFYLRRPRLSTIPGLVCPLDGIPSSTPGW